jgi:hypothetical protein
MSRTVWVPKQAVADVLPRDAWTALDKVARFPHDRVAVTYAYERAQGGHVVKWGGYGFTVAEVFEHDVTQK